MTRELRFGFVIPQLVPWPAMVTRFRQAEEWGLDSAWVVDHFVNPAWPEGRWFEGWTMLAALATQTVRLRIGVLVTSISFRNPALLAKEALTVDHISGGRLDLGIGAGGQQRDHTMTGSAPWPAAERVDRFHEFVQIVDQMLREDVTTYEGRHYRVQEAIMTPGPVQRPRPPLTIGGTGPKMLRVVAAYADCWNSSGGGIGPGQSAAALTPKDVLDNTHRRNALLDEYAAAAGRDPTRIRRSLLAGGGSNPEHPWASPEAFADFVGRYREAGIDEFLLYYPSRAEQAAGHVERIAREVMPRLRGEERGTRTED